MLKKEKPPWHHTQLKYLYFHLNRLLANMADTKLLCTKLTCAVTTTENNVLLPFHANTTHNGFLQFPKLYFKLLILRDQGLVVNSNDWVTICEEIWSELNSIIFSANFSQGKPNYGIISKVTKNLFFLALKICIFAKAQNNPNKMKMKFNKT